MGYKIFLPVIKHENLTTQDIIIAILAKTFPLTIKKIYNLAKKEYNSSVSYQAFFKTINQLVEKNIVFKKNSEYELNINWIKEIEDFAKKIRETYTTSTGELITEVIEVKTEGPITEITFNCLGDLDKYFIILNKNYLSQLNLNEYVYGEVNHTWWPITNSKGEYDATKNHENYSKIRYICKSNTIIDKWVSNYYNQIGVKNKLGIDCAQHYDMWIYGDNIVQTILPLELNKIIDNYFEKPKSFSEFETEKFLKEVFDSKFNVKVIINKNLFLAEHLKKQINSYFKEKND